VGVLRLEYGTHLSVTSVYPGYVDTAIHERSRQAGVALDGLVPVISAAAAARAPRDVASTSAGTAALRLGRHAPGLVDRAVAARTGRLARGGRFSGAALAAGLRERHTEHTLAKDEEQRP
jgi:hypothetical protein